MALHITDIAGKPFSTRLPELEQRNSGKTKLVYPYASDALAIVHKDIITANDNPIYTGDAVGKGTASAYSTALLFKRIEAKGIPTSHIGILNSNTTIDQSLDMLPFEIIWRRYNVEGNSWMKRNPLSKYMVGDKYDEIKYEACLKWSVRTTEGEVVHDPFLVLDDDFNPILHADGFPQLVHSKNGSPLAYAEVIHPNKWGIMTPEQVKEAITTFSKYSGDIRKMTETIQEATFETYAEIGRLNADGKIELGVDKNGKIMLGDELELDSLRNISIAEVETSETWSTISQFSDDLLWKNLNEIFIKNASSIDRILKSRHSGKQVYRDCMKIVDSNMEQMQKAYPWLNERHYRQVRRGMNNAMAQFTTDTVYVPVAMALSERYGKEVGYLLNRE